MNDLGGYKFLKESDEKIEKIKDLQLINRLGYYDIYLEAGSYLFFDAIGLHLFKLKTKKNLTDKNSMKNLVAIYEYGTVLPCYSL